MKKLTLLALFTLGLVGCKNQPAMEWISTTPNACWQSQQPVVATTTDEVPDLIVLPHETKQQIDGFGGCFNEMGWVALQSLPDTAKTAIMRELFDSNLGASFTICRTPIGANDFSRDWYSYDEVEGDFQLANFSIQNDEETLVPYIKSALAVNPSLKLWASPWSPPAWMKKNKHYACASSDNNVNQALHNGLSIYNQGAEGTDLFITDSAHFDAYARYFAKYIDAYRKQGIEISAVMPQNEFNSCQIFPSCTWTATSLARFIGNYLGPEMQKQNVSVMLGTMERPDFAQIDSILLDPVAKQFISGVGFQWAGKDILKVVHERFPLLTLYQTEQECGDGKNSWQGAEYSWNLMRFYLENGANAYMYWNMALENGGVSRWGWAQNSLVVVDPQTKAYNYTYEYYVMKHASHFVKPGASVVTTQGTYKDAIAFVNLDGSMVLLVANTTDNAATINTAVDKTLYRLSLAPHSINTFLIKKEV